MRTSSKFLLHFYIQRLVRLLPDEVAGGFLWVLLASVSELKEALLGYLDEAVWLQVIGLSTALFADVVVLVSEEVSRILKIHKPSHPQVLLVLAAGALHKLLVEQLLPEAGPSILLLKRAEKTFSSSRAKKASNMA